MLDIWVVKNETSRWGECLIKSFPFTLSTIKYQSIISQSHMHRPLPVLFADPFSINSNTRLLINLYCSCSSLKVLCIIEILWIRYFISTGFVSFNIMFDILAHWWFQICSDAQFYICVGWLHHGILADAIIKWLLFLKYYFELGPSRFLPSSLAGTFYRPTSPSVTGLQTCFECIVTDDLFLIQL